MGAAHHSLPDTAHMQSFTDSWHTRLLKLICCKPHQQRAFPHSGVPNKQDLRVKAQH